MSKYLEINWQQYSIIQIQQYYKAHLISKETNAYSKKLHSKNILI